MTAWSFLYDEMYSDETEAIKAAGGYEWTPGAYSPDRLTGAVELTITTPNNSVYKYNEDKILQEVKDYISETYRAHYNSGSGTQTLDLIDSCGDAAAFCRSNILKYASRYDKKGSAKMDIKKIIHYAVLLYHFAGLDKETTERGYETF